MSLQINEKLTSRRKKMMSSSSKGYDEDWKDKTLEAVYFLKQDYEVWPNYLSNTGILRSTWLQPQDSHIYGTAFAISKRVIITCGHNIFCEKTRTTCNKIMFIPKVEKSKITEDMVYRNSERNFLQFSFPSQSQPFSKYINPDDLALIYLNKDLDIDDFPNVGTGHFKDKVIGKKLMSSGYASEGTFGISISQFIFERKNLTGNVISISAFDLRHDLDTEVGMSGSGMSVNIDGQQTLISIHTHGNKKLHVGIYFTKQIILKLIKFQIQIGKMHKTYPMDIRFYGNMKEELVRQIQNQRIKDHLLDRVMKFNEKRRLWAESKRHVVPIEKVNQQNEEFACRRLEEKTYHQIPLVNKFLQKKYDKPSQRVKDANHEDKKYYQVTLASKKQAKVGIQPWYFVKESSDKMESSSPKRKPISIELFQSESELSGDSDSQQIGGQKRSPQSTVAIQLSELSCEFEQLESSQTEQ